MTPFPGSKTRCFTISVFVLEFISDKGSFLQPVRHIIRPENSITSPGMDEQQGPETLLL